MLHMLQLFQRHVVSVCFECFRCFRDMFHLCFSERILQVCLSGCCICFTHTLHVFIWMLRMVAMVFQVFQKYVSSVLTTFRRMLQLLYLNVSKVDRVLHLSTPPSAASSLPTPAGHPYDAAAGSLSFPSLLLGWCGPRWARNRVQSAGVRPFFYRVLRFFLVEVCGSSSACPDAMYFFFLLDRACTDPGAMAGVGSTYDDSSHVGY
jgi:hypothetical protein